MKIALVDDDSSFAFIVEHQIKVYNSNTIGEKIEFVYYSNPVFFLHCMSREEEVCSYDIVLIDMMMPLMDGFSVHKELVEMCPNLKCFITSSSIEETDNLESMVSKVSFEIREVIARSLNITRLVNNLQVNIRRPYYETHYA